VPGWASCCPCLPAKADWTDSWPPRLGASLLSPFETDADGVVRVGGSRVTLDTLVAVFHTGDSPEEIHEQYPTVDLADIYAVLTYYLRHTREVDAYLDARD